MARASWIGAALVAAAAGALDPAGAASPADEARRLDGPLTPMGAERAGNAAGTIPAWTGGIAPAPAPKDGRRGDPFPGEPMAYAVTAANWRDYADRLPEGQQALFRKFPDYRLEVYPTHRTAAAPQAVYDAIRANLGRARPAPEGLAYGVAGAAGGIPFPIPQDGAEVVWNHLLAFWGPARQDHLRTYFVAADGTRELTHAYTETVDFPYYYPGVTPETLGPWYFKRREISGGPPALAGRGYTVWQPLDSARDGTQTWQYLPGQRRVRKSPSLAYDAPTPDGAGIVAFDDYYVFSGSPDRYVFTLEGKREMIVPYNNNRMALLPIERVAGPLHEDPTALRYELHRVWVVDAVLAPGKHHLVPHRRLYIDEDTWFAVCADSWDADGKLWKFSHGTMLVVPDLPAVVLASVFTYDLENGGYVLAFAFNGEEEQYRLTAPHPETDFAPETLASQGVR